MYSNLQKTPADINCLQKFRPNFTTVLYKAKIDVTGKHLGGLLIIKTMPDSSIRIVFTAEMGLNFFDFEFRPDGNFIVHQIIPKMNKKPVIKTLRKNFELILMQNLAVKNSYAIKDSNAVYTAFPQSKGTYYYVTSPDCSTLLKMQRASRSKPVVEAIMQHYINGIPDTIGISHKFFKFDIGLKRLEK